MTSNSELKRIAVQWQNAAMERQKRIEELESILKRANLALCGLCKVASAATPTLLGGTPDLFWPEYSDEFIKNSDSTDPWDAHEFAVRHQINLAGPIVTEIDRLLGTSATKS